MALVSTTLSAAVAVNDNAIVVASATSLAAGRYLRIDSEIMQVGTGYVVASLTVPVQRGVHGTVVATHPVTAVVVHGNGSDWAMPQGGIDDAVTYPAQPGRKILSYTTAGAISLVVGDSVHVLNGASALAMTLAQPTADMDGSVMWIVSNGKYAHTVTVAGVGYNATASGYTVITMTTGTRVALCMIAVNLVWCIPNCFYPSGTLTAAEAALS